MINDNNDNANSINGRFEQEVSQARADEGADKLETAPRGENGGESGEYSGDGAEAKGAELDGEGGNGGNAENADNDDENAEDSENGENGEADKESAEPERLEVVGVRFKPTGKAYYFAPNGFDLKLGDNVIVDTARGLEYGTVSFPSKAVSVNDLMLPVRDVLRLATAEDTARRARNAEIEARASKSFVSGAASHKLEMRLLDVECAFDQTKLIFNFSAATRIDFRELVRELASEFHTRIELKQVASRDATKLIGGLGICGRPFCCSTFLTGIVHASIKMAKDQNLSLNSAKISGACGRLMCCLKFEHSTYLAEKELTPPVGAEVMTPEGEGAVVEASPMTGLVKVRLATMDAEEAPIVFLRDDLILKSKYNGEVLTRTPLPEKRRAAPAMATFEVHSPFSESLGGAEKAEKHDKSDKSEKNAKSGKSSSDDKKKRDNRGKGKDNRQNAGKGAMKPEQTVDTTAHDGGDGEELFERTGGKHDRADRADKNGKRGKGQGRQGFQSRNNQNSHAHGEDAEGETAVKGDKKPFKPHNTFDPNRRKSGQGAGGAAERTDNAVAQPTAPAAERSQENREGGKKYHKPYYRRGGKQGGNGSGKGNGNGNG